MASLTIKSLTQKTSFVTVINMQPDWSDWLNKRQWHAFPLNIVYENCIMI